MKYIVSSEQMKALDNRTINELGIPSRVLMETAGKGCADYLHQHYADKLAFGAVVLCGFGNNGGDGYVIARWLKHYKYDVSIIAVARGNMSHETLENQKLCEKLKINITKYWEADEDVVNDLEYDIQDCGVVIDAIYGIGFKGNLSDKITDLISSVEICDVLTVAIDIPSGLNADNGCCEECFPANLTLAIDSMKTGHIIGSRKHFCGKVVVIPIGIPASYYNDINASVLIDDDLAMYPFRQTLGNKGDFGRVAVFAGSPGYTGAAFMASQACIKAGAGLVTIFAHPEYMLHFAGKPYEVMVTEIPVLSCGSIDYEAVTRKLDRYNLILFGPGLGVTEHNTRLLGHILQTWDKKLVIDADGLNILAANRELLPFLKEKKIVLTPHWGEFCRLADVSMPELESDPIGQAKRFAGEYSVTLLLKSYTTIYIDKSVVMFNTAGNDGLATGGSGDVLSGLIAGLMTAPAALPWTPLTASFCLGKTAEKLAEKQKTFSITPTDILDNIFKL